MKRIKSLDGMRAVGVLMVILGHASPTIPTIITNNILFKLFSNSHLGVMIFFVISGYLITTLLIAEQIKNQTIDLKAFYMRRIFRIFPVFYLYILVLLVSKFFFKIDYFSSYYTIFFAAIYIWNYKQVFSDGINENNGNWFCGHFWSLALEEQFYLIWPFFFERYDLIKLRKYLFIIIAVMPIIRLITYFIFPNSRGQIGMMLQTGSDSILIGCLAAIYELDSNFRNRVLPYIQKTYIVILVAIFVFIVNPILEEKFRGLYGLPIGSSLVNISIIILLLYVTKCNSWVTDFLNTRLISKIGTLSYSLYIWQQLFLNNRFDFAINKFPLNVLIVFIVGFISYHFFEKPILKFKARFSRV